MLQRFFEELRDRKALFAVLQAHKRLCAAAVEMVADPARRQELKTMMERSFIEISANNLCCFVANARADKPGVFCLNVNWNCNRISSLLREISVARKVQEAERRQHAEFMASEDAHLRESKTCLAAAEAKLLESEVSITELRGRLEAAEGAARKERAAAAALAATETEALREELRVERAALAAAKEAALMARLAAERAEALLKRDNAAWECEVDSMREALYRRDDKITALQAEIATLKAEPATLKAELAAVKGELRALERVPHELAQEQLRRADAERRLALKDGALREREAQAKALHTLCDDARAGIKRALEDVAQAEADAAAKRVRPRPGE